MAKKFASDKPTIAEIRRLKTPARKTVTIVLDDAAAAEIADLEKKLAEAEAFDADHNAAPTAPAVEEQLEQARDEFREMIVEFTFEAMGRKAYDELVDAHPPTPKQKEDGYSYNPETHAAALIVASCIDPEMSLADAQAIWEEWGTAEAQLLYMTAVAVNAAGERRVPKSVLGTGPTRRSGPSSTTASPSVSPTASS